MPPQPGNARGAYNKIAEDVKRRLINAYMEGEDYMAAARMFGIKVTKARSIIVRHKNSQPIEDQRGGRRQGGEADG